MGNGDLGQSLCPPGCCQEGVRRAPWLCSVDCALPVPGGSFPGAERVQWSSRLYSHAFLSPLWKVFRSCICRALSRSPSLDLPPWSDPGSTWRAWSLSNISTIYCLDSCWDPTSPSLFTGAVTLMLPSFPCCFVYQCVCGEHCEMSSEQRAPFWFLEKIDSSGDCHNFLKPDLEISGEGPELFTKRNHWLSL